MRVSQTEKLAIQRVPELLGSYLDAPVSVEQQARTSEDRLFLDLIVVSGRRRFLIEVKSSGEPGPVKQGIEQLKRAAALSPSRQDVPLLVVPYMGSTGAKLCKEEGISWLDLSGNASITARDLRIYLTGMRNQFTHRGPAGAIFSTKGSRVARQLLLQPQRAFSQSELVQSTQLSQGYVSTILSKLQENGYLTTADGKSTVKHPHLLLKAWREKYDFYKHSVIKGHLASRTPESALRDLSVQLTNASIKHAATGLAGAWLLDRFASFGLVTILLETELTMLQVEQFGIRTDSNAPNVWLATSADSCEFQGSCERDGIPCAHPLQVYLDLKSQPERADEAAEHLRESMLTFENTQRNAKHC